MKNKWIKVCICLTLAIVLIGVGVGVFWKSGYNLETMQGKKEAIADLKGESIQQVDIIASHVHEIDNQSIYLIVVRGKTGYDFYLFEKKINHLYEKYYEHQSNSFQLNLKIKDKKHGLYFVFATNQNHQIEKMTLFEEENKETNLFVDQNQDYVLLSFDNKTDSIIDTILLDEYGLFIDLESSYQINVNKGE